MRYDETRGVSGLSPPPPPPPSSSSQRRQAFADKATQAAEEHVVEYNIHQLSTIEDEPLQVRQKRILYRCKQRGLLELDLLVGSWAERHISQLTGSALRFWVLDFGFWVLGFGFWVWL